MAPKAYRMDDLDTPTVDNGDGKSTVDPRSTHGRLITPDGKSTIDTSEYIGPDPADSPSGGVAVEPTSASGKVDPEFQSVPGTEVEDKPKATRRGRPSRAKAEDKAGDDDAKSDDSK